MGEAFAEVPRGVEPLCGYRRGGQYRIQCSTRRSLRRLRVSRFRRVEGIQSAMPIGRRFTILDLARFSGVHRTRPGVVHFLLSTRASRNSDHHQFRLTGSLELPIRRPSPREKNPARHFLSLRPARFYPLCLLPLVFPGCVDTHTTFSEIAEAPSCAHGSSDVLVEPPPALLF